MDSLRHAEEKIELILPESAPEAFHLLAKPTGAICNLDCAYCFFLDKELLYPGSKFRMSDEVLERYIFLSTIFDEWVHNDVGRVYVQTIEAAIRNWVGLLSSGMCVFNETCGLGLAIEHNSDLYACDHFVEPNYFLGNIQDEHMIVLVSSEQQVKFGQDKRDTLPQFCLDCDVRFACHGECPKNRFCEAPLGTTPEAEGQKGRGPQVGVGIKTPDGLSPYGDEPGLNYLCTGFKHFFHHIDYPAGIVASLIRRGRPAAEVMGILAENEARWAALFAGTGRNHPCPCGSGRKFKLCHAKPGEKPPLKPAPGLGLEE